MGSFPFARRYLENRCFFLFLRLLRCFSSPGSLRNTMNSCYGDTITRTGFPHSEIHGSKPAYGSPWLIAVNHVLRRLLVPRHSPCALISLISLFDPHCCLHESRHLKLQISAFVSTHLPTSFSFLMSFSPRITSLCSFQGAWWAQVDSNHRPHAYQACALTC